MLLINLLITAESLKLGVQLFCLKLIKTSLKIGEVGPCVQLSRDLSVGFLFVCFTIEMMVADKKTTEMTTGA